MKYVFGDTVYWLGLINPKDDHHAEALRAERELEGVAIVTTDSVLGEVLASLSRRHDLRAGVLKLLRDARNHPNMEIVHQHVGLFNRAIERYERQGDRTASLVDCISMEVMDDYGITEVLTADRDFEREGYIRLMRNPSEQRST